MSEHEHRFSIGQNVNFSNVFARPGGESTYTVVALMPADGGDNQYRIKSLTEPHDRVVKESQLEPA